MIFVKSNHIFTDYAHAKQKGDLKEAERISKIIDENARISRLYIEEIQLAYMFKPNLPKLSFDEWLKLRHIDVIDKEHSEFSVIVEAKL